MTVAEVITGQNPKMRFQCVSPTRIAPWLRVDTADGSSVYSYFANREVTCYRVIKNSYYTGDAMEMIIHTK